MRMDDRDEMPVNIASGSSLGIPWVPAEDGIAGILIDDDAGCEVDADAQLFDGLLAKTRERRA